MELDYVRFLSEIPSWLFELTGYYFFVRGMTIVFDSGRKLDL